MKATDIAFAFTGDLHRNIRALKQLRSLSEGGYSVKVFHLGGNAAPTDLPPHVSEQVVAVEQDRGFRYFRNLETAFKAALLAHSARLFHASDLYTLEACADAARRQESLYSFDSRELYAHVAATRGRPWVRWWWSRLERRLLPGSACTFAVSDGIADYLERKYDIGRPVVVHNVPERSTEPTDHSSLVPAQTMPIVLDDRGIASHVPIVVHLGQMKKDRGCEQLILAMEHVSSAHLVFLGYGPIERDLKKLVASRRLSGKVHFLPPVGPREVRTALTGATIGVTMLEDTCLNHRYALPNKLFDYMSAGLPVLASNLDEVARVVRGHDLGRTADPQDPLDIAAAITGMVSHPDLPKWSKNSLAAAETFSWENASQPFMQEINRVLPPASSP